MNHDGLRATRTPMRPARVRNTAFVFAGQGSQRVGMAASLRRGAPRIFRRYLARAGAASGLPIARLCAEGPSEALTATEAAQPALVAIALAIAALARDRGVEPDFVAGHSLGEYTAAIVAGALDLDDGMRLVAQRGRLMAEIEAERPGAMAAIMGLGIDEVQELCAKAAPTGAVTPANVNTPSQIVCSGDNEAVATLTELAKEAGAERVVRLNVGAAFHSPMMAPVQWQMAEAMTRVAWSDPMVPLVGSMNGELKTTAGAVREELIDQITSRVSWVECVRTLQRERCGVFLELGATPTLGGLIRQIDRDAETFFVDGPQKLDDFERLVTRATRGERGMAFTVPISDRAGGDRSREFRINHVMR